jgi:hypothetical protein
LLCEPSLRALSENAAKVSNAISYKPALSSNRRTETTAAAALEIERPANSVLLNGAPVEFSVESGGLHFGGIPIATPPGQAVPPNAFSLL